MTRPEILMLKKIYPRTDITKAHVFMVLDNTHKLIFPTSPEYRKWSIKLKHGVWIGKHRTWHLHVGKKKKDGINYIVFGGFSSVLNDKGLS